MFLFVSNVDIETIVKKLLKNGFLATLVKITKVHNDNMKIEKKSKVFPDILSNITKKKKSINIVVFFTIP